NPGARSSRTTGCGPRRPSRTHFGVDGAGAIGGLALADIGRADEDRDLAEVLVVTQELMSLADLLEAHRLPQHRADLRFLDQLVCLRRLPGVGEVRPQDLLLAHPQVADVEVELVPGRS